MERSWPMIEDILKIAERHVEKETPAIEFYPAYLSRRIGENSEYDAKLAYNIKLLKEEGYISAGLNSTSGIGRLFWKGHNLLDDIRSASIHQAARN